MLQCGTGSDRANGGAGNDILVGGGLGKDSLTGGAGADIFVFNNLAFNSDVIVDFKVGEDLIALRAMLAKETYVGANAAEKFQNYVQLEQVSGGTLLKVDTDGNGSGAVMTNLALLQAVEATSLTASSFIV